MDAFGIFEGGGTKGLAHVGALKVAEEQHIRFLGVAGASAGAVVAAFVAAGYDADELYCPARRDGVLATDFLDILDRDRWESFRLFKGRLAAALAAVGGGGSWRWPMLSFLWKNRSTINDLKNARGFLCTTKFESWFDEQLRQKTRKRKGSIVTFEDLPKLKIIITDVTNQRARLYCFRNTPKASVVEAVAASISIPFVFAPRLIDGCACVDGGLSSNFPAWAFDADRKAAKTPTPLIPTFGFRLVPRQRAEVPPPEVDQSLVSYCKNLFTTAVFGDYSLETREVDNLYEIPLRVRVGTLDFEMTSNLRDDVYHDGKDSARDFFLNEFVGPRIPGNLDRLLKTAHGFMLKTIGIMNCHLRLNVFRPAANNRIRILQTFGHAQEDCDDRLEFIPGSGAAGVCWRDREAVICDLDDMDNDWGLDKYQRRHVRPSLKSILCVPIFDSDTTSKDGKPNSASTMLGVLSFDSDERLTEEFAKPPVLQAARECAKLVEGELKR